MATATVERVTYSEQGKHPGGGRGLGGAAAELGTAYEPLLASESPPPPRPG